MPTFILYVLILISTTANAMTVLPRDIDEALAGATLVADIEVIDHESRVDSDSLIRSQYKLRILHIYSISDDGGWLPVEGDNIHLSTLGGEVGGIGMFVTGYPRPYIGKKYKAFLKRKQTDEFEIAGFEFGLIPNSPHRDYTRNRTDGSNGEGTGPYLYWDKRYLPIPYYISTHQLESIPTAVTAIDTSFRTWRDILDVTIEFQPMGCTLETRNQNDGLNNIILVTDKWQFDATAIAITRNFYVSGMSERAGLILDSDILLNGVSHSFTTTNETGKHDVQNIVTHEIGHLLGIGHEIAPFETNATMYAQAAPNEIMKRDLHNNDLRVLHEAYGGVIFKPMLPQNPGPSCLPGSVRVGCLSVHNNANNPASNVLMGLALVVTLLLGRLGWKASRRH